MSSSDLEQLLSQEPIPTLRLTMSSGDVLIIRDEDRPIAQGLVIVLRGPEGRTTRQLKLISIPNIVLVEPFVARPGNGRGRRRK